jgi:hypothetical protein
MDTTFLDQLAHLLKIDKTAACRRAINRLLVEMKRHCDAGEYVDQAEAEDEFRKRIADESTCHQQPPADRK